MLKQYSKLVNNKCKKIVEPSTSSSTDTEDWSLSTDESNLDWFSEMENMVNSDINGLVDGRIITSHEKIKYDQEFIIILCIMHEVLSDKKIILLSQKLKIDEKKIRLMIYKYSNNN